MGKRTGEERTHGLLEAIAESVLKATDEEIIEDIKVQGRNPAVVAQEVRAILFQGMIAHKKTKLLAAQRQHEKQVAELREKSFVLPDTPNAKRTLLTKILSVVPEYRTTLLTTQYRDLSDLSDEDVRQHLVQLAQLGVLEDSKLRERGD